MKFRSKKIKFSLLLEYNQTMHFISIEEILLYVTKQISHKLKTPIYKPGSIDEFNRVIVKGNIEYLKFVSSKLNKYGIRSYIGNINDVEFVKKRHQYIKYKFPFRNLHEVDNELKQNYINNIKTSLSSYEPIILEIDDKEKYENEKLVCIAYKQNKTWSYILEKLEWIKRKYFSKNRFFDIKEINKYNRIFFHSKNEKIIMKLNSKLNENDIKTLILNNEEELIPYRMEYITYYYGIYQAPLLHTKWKLEYENGWYTKEKWDPIIVLTNKE